MRNTAEYDPFISRVIAVYFAAAFAVGAAAIEGEVINEESAKAPPGAIKIDLNELGNFSGHDEVFLFTKHNKDSAKEVKCGNTKQKKDPISLKDGSVIVVCDDPYR